MAAKKASRMATRGKRLQGGKKLEARKPLKVKYLTIELQNPTITSYQA